MGGKGRDSASSMRCWRASRRGRTAFAFRASRRGDRHDVFDEFIAQAELSALALSDASDETIDEAFLRRLFRLHSNRTFWRSWSGREGRSPSAPPACSRTPTTSRSPAFTARLCSRTPIPTCGCGSASWRRRVKLVYASTFSKNAKAYVANTPHRPEEEKMAVVVQEIVGRPHGRYFLPSFGGRRVLANYYPVLGLKAEEGLAAVALGFGRTVVEGGRAVRFSPGSPRKSRNSPQSKGCSTGASGNSTRSISSMPQRSESLATRMPSWALSLETAERDGTLHQVGSVYSADNDAVYDGVSRPGIRLVTFAPILKTGVFHCRGP